MCELIWLSLLPLHVPLVTSSLWFYCMNIHIIHIKNIVLVHLCWLKMAFCSLMLKSEGLKSTGVYKCDIYMYQPYMHPILENARAIVYDMSTSSFKTKYRIPYHTRQQKQNEGFANTTSVELLKYFNQAKIQWHRPIEKQWLWRLPELGISRTVTDMWNLVYIYLVIPTDESDLCF